jgi:hypothetical protein
MNNGRRMEENVSNTRGMLTQHASKWCCGKFNGAHSKSLKLERSKRLKKLIRSIRSKMSHFDWVLEVA